MARGKRSVALEKRNIGANTLQSGGRIPGGRCFSMERKGGSAMHSAGNGMHLFRRSVNAAAAESVAGARMPALKEPSQVSIIPGLRWWIIGLIFAVTCINYINRSSIGLLYTQFGGELHISTVQYGWVGAILLLAYAVSQLVSGRLYDCFGARAGFTLSVVVWCVAAMAHSLIMGFVGFASCSFLWDWVRQVTGLARQRWLPNGSRRKSAPWGWPSLLEAPLRAV